MTRRIQFSTRLLMGAVASFAVSIAMVRVALTWHAISPAATAFRGIAYVSLGASVGWPFGFVIAGRSGAVVGAILGVVSLFVVFTVHLEFLSDLP